MPLRDHFRPPLSTVSRWQALHAVWPTMILQRLNPLLPEGYRAEPRVQLGTEYEIDIGTIDARPARADGHPHAGGGGTAVLTAHAPTVNEATELDEPDEVGVRVYGADGELVAAVELVSRRNKDRPDSRRDFAEKVAALVRRGVCVSVVDVVSDRRFNLYADALDLLGHTNPSIGDPAPNVRRHLSRGRSPSRSAVSGVGTPASTRSAAPDHPALADRRSVHRLESGVELRGRLPGAALARHPYLSAFGFSVIFHRRFVLFSAPPSNCPSLKSTL